MNSRRWDISLGDKTCTKCLKALPLSDFSLHNGKPRHACKNCASEAYRVWLNKNKARRSEQNKEWCKNNKDRVIFHANKTRKSRMDFLWGKKSVPCADCGIKYHPWVMHFDHRNPQLKVFNVGHGVTKSMERLVSEINKCDVVCANCHSERTYWRRKTVDEKAGHSCPCCMKNRETYEPKYILGR